MTLDDYKLNSLARLYATRDKTAEQFKKDSAADQLAHLRDELDAGEYAERAQRRIAILARYEEDGEEMKKAMSRAETAHKTAKRKLRQNRLYNKFHILFPLYRDLALTAGDKAILIALMICGKGEKRIEVAKKKVAKVCGASTKSVQTTLHKLAAHNLLHIEERRIKGKAMNLWNVYTLKCSKILAWCKHHFISIKGEAIDPHPQGGLYPVTTEGEPEAKTAPEASNVKSCRQKAMRYEGFGASVGLSSEDFVLVASGALRELDIDLPDNPSESELIERIEDYREKHNPGYKQYFWDKGVRRHGLRRALLAVLCTHLTKQMRLCPIPDKRPYNERQTVKCPNRFLSGILKRETTGTNACRPEVTIGAKLLNAQIYELPVDLLRAVRERGREKHSIKRYQSSAA